MTIGRPLERGANVALTRENPNLAGVVLGVRWDTGADQVLADNLVAAAMLCGADHKVISDQHFVFVNQLVSPDLSVARLDELLGDDKEQLEVDLAGVPEDVERIVVVVYLNEGSTARRSLGQLRSCAVRILDLADNRELARSVDLAPALQSETALVIGYLYRYRRQGGPTARPPEWRFRVVGQGYSAGLRGVATDYGVPL
jgi:tellurium resistance protein TerD